MGRQVWIACSGFVGQRTDGVGLQGDEVARQAVEIIALGFDQAPMQNIARCLPIGVRHQRRAQFLQGVERLEATGDGVSDHQGSSAQGSDQDCHVEDVDVSRGSTAHGVQVDQAGA